MARYLYRVELSRAVTIEQRKRAKAELRRLFKSHKMPAGEGFTFEFTTPLEPLAAQAALAEFARNFGAAAITLGSKVK